MIDFISHYTNHAADSIFYSVESVTYLHLSIHNQRGCSALLLASKNGHLEVVKFLLEKGANFHDIDDVR